MSKYTNHVIIPKDREVLTSLLLFSFQTLKRHFATTLHKQNPKNTVSQMTYLC